MGRGIDCSGMMFTYYFLKLFDNGDNQFTHSGMVPNV